MTELVDDLAERAVHLSATVDGRDATGAAALTKAGRLALARGGPAVAAELLARAAHAA